MSKPNKEIVEEYNIIRVFATLLVVIGHSGYISPMTEYGGISMGEYPVPVIQTAIDMLIRLIYTFHMPLFFSLSGALFYRKIAINGYRNTKDLIKNKTKRLLIPYILCTLLWVIPIKAIAGYWSHSSNVIQDIIEGQILLLGNTHMWFLWVLFVITLLSYLLRNVEFVRIIVAITMFIIGGSCSLSFLGIDRILLNFIWFEFGIQYEKHRSSFINVFKKRDLLILPASVLNYLVSAEQT